MTPLSHAFVTWISGSVIIVNDKRVTLTASCSKCKDQTRRDYCCQKIAAEYGWPAYAYLHGVCDRLNP